MADEPDVVVRRRDPWAPQVIRRDGRLLLDLHVASGHWDRDYELALEPRHVDVLRDDAERYWLLFAALHHPYQLAETVLDDAELTRWLDTVLLGGRDDVEAFLSALDHSRANGAIANLLRIVTGADYDAMRAGRWFAR